MPALLIFLLKVNAALLLFCEGYYLVLRPLTFYTLNRFYLVSAIVFATIYPKINLSDFAERHQELARPVQMVVFNWQRPAEALVKPITQPNYWYWVELAFWAGAIFLAGRLLMQLFSLYRLYHNSKPVRLHGHDVRVIEGISGPFSFWRSIYVDPANHDPADLKSILLHEQVHVNEWHTLDILLAELSTIFYWFNPGIWLMKKAVRENIEFITDQKILNKGVDSKQYQYSLVSVSFASSSNTIVNHFNISTIKKRIIMMNAKRSSKFKLTRYAFLVPAVVGMLLVFSISKAALVNKSAGTYKAIVAAMHKGGLTADKSVNAAIAANKRLVQKAPFLTASFLIPHLSLSKMQDTIKRGDVFISTNERADSLNYVINGVKVTEADYIKAIESHKIYQMIVMTSKEAGKVLADLDNGHHTIFVTTDDSEDGKKFKEKIDAVNGNYYILSSKMLTFKNNSATTTARSPETFTLNTTNGTYTVRKRSNIRTNKGYQLIPDSGNYDPIVLNYSTTSDSSGQVAIVGQGSSKNAKLARVTGKNAPMTLTYSAQGNKTVQFKNHQSIWNNDEETNISHLSTKLIMIDGKEASEKDLKKLSAADIESMSAKSGEDVTEKYGDKAKNGVLFITTKKASK